MKVKLTLKDDANEITSLKFAKTKEMVPDTARYLYTYFGDKISFSDLLVNITDVLPSLNLIRDHSDLNLVIPGTNDKLIEFIVNLKLFSMKIGRLLFEFERELLENCSAVNSFINRHELNGFSFKEFKSLLVQHKFDEILDLLGKQFDNLKKTFYVLFNDRYNLLDSKGYI